MKYPDNYHLSPLFQLESKEYYLKTDSEEQQRIVAIKKIYRIKKLCYNETKKKKTSKNTCISLLPDECNEFLEDELWFYGHNVIFILLYELTLFCKRKIPTDSVGIFEEL